MNNVKKLMLEEAENRINDLRTIEVGSDEYCEAVNGITKLVITVSDLEDREKSNELKEKEAHDQKIDRLVDRTTKIINTVTAFAVPVGIALLSIGLERKDNLMITTDAGKNSLRNCLNFWPKR
jgi:hypothetical protein